MKGAAKFLKMQNPYIAHAPQKQPCCVPRKLTAHHWHCDGRDV